MRRRLRKPLPVRQSIALLVMGFGGSGLLAGCQSGESSSSYKDGYTYASGLTSYWQTAQNFTQVCNEEAAGVGHMPIGDDPGQWEAGCVAGAQAEATKNSGSSGNSGNSDNSDNSDHSDNSA